MTTEEHIPWLWLLLGILDDHHGQATLQEIYECIDKQQHEMTGKSTQLIEPELFGVDPRYGIRHKYQHTVRGCLSNYKKRGLVDRIETATYRITDKGLKRLRWFKDEY